MRNLTTECDGWRQCRRDLWVGTSRVQPGGSLLVAVVQAGDMRLAWYTGCLTWVDLAG